MSQTIFLAECMDKNNHSEDQNTVQRLMNVQGIEDIFETHVRYENKEYCIAAISLVEKKHVKKIANKMKTDPNIKAVKAVSSNDTPFLAQL